MEVLAYMTGITFLHSILQIAANDVNVTNGLISTRMESAYKQLMTYFCITHFFINIANNNTNW